MKHLLAILVLAACAATAQGQTIKAVSFNTTNNTVVSTNRITFPLLGAASGTAATPSLSIASGTNVFGVFATTQLGVGVYLGFSVDGTRRFYISTNTIRAELPISFSTTTNAAETRTNLELGATNDVSFNSVAVTNAGATRTNLGIPLPALTNTNAQNLLDALGVTGGDSLVPGIQVDRAKVLWDGADDDWGFQAVDGSWKTQAVFTTTNAPTNTNAAIWIAVEIGTNTYKLPLFQ
jgi:hypothetical protein